MYKFLSDSHKINLDSSKYQSKAKEEWVLIQNTWEFPPLLESFNYKSKKKEEESALIFCAPQIKIMVFFFGITKSSLIY